MVVEFGGTFGGKEGMVRGSPCTIDFAEFVSRDNNTMAGKLVLDALKQDLNFLLEFSRKTSEGVQVSLRIRIRIRIQNHNYESQLN